MNNKRKALRLMGICVVVALPCLASADAPRDMAAGEVDAILKFCAKSDPRLEESVEKLRKLLGGGTGSSAAYKQGYDLASDALERADKTTVRAACSAGLTGSEPDGRGTQKR